MRDQSNTEQVFHSNCFNQQVTRYSFIRIEDKITDKAPRTTGMGKNKNKIQIKKR